MQYLKDEMKEKIENSALHEFMEKGYENASIRSIASNAHMTSGNIYRYFENKEALFNFIIAPVREQFLKYWCDLLASVISSNINIENFNRVVYNQDIYKRQLQSFAEHKIELLVLLDKSEGTKFSGTKEEIKQYIKEIILNIYSAEFKKQGKKIQDHDIFYVIASSYVEGMCDILRNSKEDEKVRYLLELFGRVIFHDLSRRI